MSRDTAQRRRTHHAERSDARNHHPENEFVDRWAEPQPRKISQLGGSALGKSELEWLTIKLLAHLMEQGKGWTNIPIQTLIDWEAENHLDPEQRQLFILRRINELLLLAQGGWIAVTRNGTVIHITKQFHEMLTPTLERHRVG